MVHGIQDANALCSLLSDPTRLRLLALLEQEDLSVAELTEILQLAQSRVSTHLSRLREAGMVKKEERDARHQLDLRGMPEEARRFWQLVRGGLADPVIEADLERAQELVRARQTGRTWAETVAGMMERHYSPGRTCEATLRACLGFAKLGDVIDIGSGDGVIAELVAARAKSVTCVDVSEAVVEAGRRRLAGSPTVRFEVGDMHALPFPDASFDEAMMLNTLTYAADPKQALAEARRVLRPGGRLVGITLSLHDNAAAVSTYDHKNLGFEPEALRALLDHCGFEVDLCESTVREKRAPYFEVITLHARVTSTET